MSELKPCPCGKVPENLTGFFCDIGVNNTSMFVHGGCCNKWYVRMDEGIPAQIAWNAAPRGQEGE